MAKLKNHIKYLFLGLVPFIGFKAIAQEADSEPTSGGDAAQSSASGSLSAGAIAAAVAAAQPGALIWHTGCAVLASRGYGTVAPS